MPNSNEKQSIQEIADDIVHNIIDTLIAKSEDAYVATHWGEKSLLLCDVINIINNAANTDYKRYYASGCQVKYKDCSPHLINKYCELCEYHFSRQENKQGCLGTENKSKVPCEKFKTILEL